MRSFCRWVSATHRYKEWHVSEVFSMTAYRHNFLVQVLAHYNIKAGNSHRRNVRIVLKTIRVKDNQTNSTAEINFATMASQTFEYKLTMKAITMIIIAELSGLRKKMRNPVTTTHPKGSISSIDDTKYQIMWKIGIGGSPMIEFWFTFSCSGHHFIKSSESA